MKLALTAYCLTVRYPDKVINRSLLVLSGGVKLHNCKVLNYGNHGRNYWDPFGMVTFSLLF